MVVQHTLHIVPAQTAKTPQVLVHLQIDTDQENREPERGGRIGKGGRKVGQNVEREEK